MLLAFSMPGEPAVVALRCLMAAAWPGWSRLQPLEKDRSTICLWPSEPIPGVGGDVVPQCHKGDFKVVTSEMGSVRRPLYPQARRRLIMTPNLPMTIRRCFSRVNTSFFGSNTFCVDFFTSP
ncbi:hypothetical protein EYF80_031149 [Liparis tanakae]|uniref:Uncharacterized protein n=1 Tax=Liparis tanakae TaxID=230148 RepID=A0A4Z2GYN9_9TELE|nr:hypothetical protein EYF80_031149 [Liparis tanakae]